MTIADRAGWVSIPFLNPESRAQDVAVELAADVPAFGLCAGQVVTVHPTGKIDCDAIFAFADGSLARLQTWGRGTYRKTDVAGAVQIVTPEALGKVMGRVLARRVVQS